MPTFYSDLRTNDRNSPPTKNPVTRLGGRVRNVTTRFTVPASGMVANDLVELFVLRKGEAILPGSKVFWATGEAAQTLDVGDATVEDRYLAAQAVTTAGSALMEAQLASGADIVIATADTPILAKFEAATPLAGQVLTFHFRIVMD